MGCVWVAVARGCSVGVLRRTPLSLGSFGGASSQSSLAAPSLGAAPLLLCPFFFSIVHVCAAMSMYVCWGGC